MGRPNVGKSTLFNRLLGKRVAIIEDEPGTTRDRLYADVTWQDSAFTIVDTGGLLLSPPSDMGQSIKEQVGGHVKADEWAKLQEKTGWEQKSISEF